MPWWVATSAEGERLVAPPCAISQSPSALMAPDETNSQYRVFDMFPLRRTDVSTIRGGTAAQGRLTSQSSIKKSPRPWIAKLVMTAFIVAHGPTPA